MGAGVNFLQGPLLPANPPAQKTQCKLTALKSQHPTLKPRWVNGVLDSTGTQLNPSQTEHQNLSVFIILFLFIFYFLRVDLLITPCLYYIGEYLPSLGSTYLGSKDHFYLFLWKLNVAVRVENTVFCTMLQGTAALCVEAAISLQQPDIPQ